MISAEVISELKAHSIGLKVLYVEDNEGLRTQAVKLLGKMYDDLDSAEDGAAGLQRFRAKEHDIVITDIRMPKLDGLEMTKRIRRIKPETKVIVTSAFDDKEYLFEAIEAGVFRYLKKPLPIKELTEVLRAAADEIRASEYRGAFEQHAREMLENQDDLLLLLNGDKPVFANQKFFDFFGVESIPEFQAQHESFGKVLERHKGFLFNLPGRTWFELVRHNPDKLYHTKIVDAEKKSRHFILKLHPVPKKAEHYILSLYDVTELNLLELFDPDAMKQEDSERTRETLFNLFDIVYKNSAEIKIHNFYRGITITNPSVVVNVGKDEILIKATYLQQKAALLDKRMIISSELFPTDVECAPLKKIDYEEQTIAFSDARFLERSPTERTYVRIEPEEDHTVTLFYHDRKFFGECTIADLSMQAVRLRLDALPAGMAAEDKVTVDMILKSDGRPLIINTPGQIYRVDQTGHHYYLVVVFDMPDKHRKELINYISKRQMALIREFKGMQYGK